MPEEYFVSQTPDGYNLKRKVRKKGEIIEWDAWETVLRGGKTFEDLLKSIDNLPLSLRAGAKINYGRPEVPFPLTDAQKGMINLRVELI